MREVCAVVCMALLLAVALAAGPNVKPPQMYVYTRTPPKHGEPNEFICHGSSFYPPKIDIMLMADGKEVEDCKQTDLSFKEDWTYYTTKFTKINYKEGTEYKCVVRHNDGDAKAYVLETLM